MIKLSHLSGIGLLFIDGSVNMQRKIGCGAYLFLDECEKHQKGLENRIKIKKFNNTSSTKLEIQTLIWALKENKNYTEKLIIYTDSQNIIGLQDRRKAIEEKKFFSSKGKLLNQHQLYRIFFELVQDINCEFVKIKGHQASVNKNASDRIFTLVDRAARQEARKLSRL